MAGEEIEQEALVKPGVGAAPKAGKKKPPKFEEMPLVEVGILKREFFANLYLCSSFLERRRRGPRRRLARFWSALLSTCMPRTRKLWKKMAISLRLIAHIWGPFKFFSCSAGAVVSILPAERLLPPSLGVVTWILAWRGSSGPSHIPATFPTLERLVSRSLVTTF